MPQLKRVLVSDGERVVMEETLEKSLEALFGKASSITVEDDGEERTSEDLIREAQEIYDNILENAGTDWTAFGENLDRLGEILNRLS